jgi:hypothetical protein
MASRRDRETAVPLEHVREETVEIGYTTAGSWH